MLVLFFVAISASHFWILADVLHFDRATALQDAVVSAGGVTFGAWSIYLVVNAYPTTAMFFLYALVAAVVMTAAVCYADFETLKWLADNPVYIEWLKHTMIFRALFYGLLLAWMGTNGALRKMLSISEEKFRLQSDAATLLREAELFKLRQQLQPHFLYNSLNSINALILLSPAKAQQMTGRLSDFLRSSVKRESEDSIPLSEELEYVQSYLDIESVRFGDRLTVSINNNMKEDLPIPPFLLQPVIENAIKFGLYGKTGAVEIGLDITWDGASVVFTITNPFDPHLAPPKGTGFGLEGIKRRLWLLYARTDLLDTRFDDTHFTTTLKIPASYV
jgi:two-component system, LytTR family, sensor kinase